MGEAIPGEMMKNLGRAIKRWETREKYFLKHTRLLRKATNKYDIPVGVGTNSEICYILEELT